MAPRFQTLTLNAGNTSASYVGDPVNVSISGTFDSGTVTQTLPGDSVAIATFTAEDSFFMNANRMDFGISGGAGSEDIPFTPLWSPKSPRPAGRRSELG